MINSGGFRLRALYIIWQLEHLPRLSERMDGFPEYTLRFIIIIIIITKKSDWTLSLLRHVIIAIIKSRDQNLRTIIAIRCLQIASYNLYKYLSP